VLSLAVVGMLPSALGSDSQASIGISPNYHIRKVHSQALFNEHGINNAVALALKEITEVFSSSTAFDFSMIAIGELGLLVENGAIYLRLFDQMGEAPTGPFIQDPNHEQMLSQFTYQWWQLVFLQDDVLTLWMVDPYRYAEFGVGLGYESSMVRAQMLSDLDDVLYLFPDKVKDIIVPTNNVSWQVAQGNTSASANTYTNPEVPDDDLIWLPSVYEIYSVGNQDGSHIAGDILTNSGIRTGQWDMNGFDRGFISPMGHSWSATWVRSAYSDGWTRAVVGQGAGISISGAGDLQGVRPAIHIDLNELFEERALGTPANVALSSNIAVTWDAVPNAVGYHIYVDGIRYTTTAITTPRTFDVSGIRPGLPIQVRAMAAVSNPLLTFSGLSSSVARTPVALSAPTGVTVSGSNLTWNTVASATGYYVYVNGNPHSPATGTTFPLSLDPGNYNLQVRTIGDGNETGWQNSGLSLAATHNVNPQMNSPTNFTAVRTGANTRTLTASWDAVTTADGQTGFGSVIVATSGITYRVYMSLNSGAFEFVDTTTGTSLVVELPGPGEFELRISALSANTHIKTSLFSHSAPVEIPQVSLETPEILEVVVYGNIVSWNAIPNAIGYYIYIDGQKHSQRIAGTTFDLSTILSNGVFNIQVRAIGDDIWYMSSGLSAVTPHTISDDSGVNLLWLWILLGAIVLLAIIIIPALMIQRKRTITR